MDEKGLAPVSGKWLHQGPPIRDTREEEQLFKVQNKSEKAGVKESKDHLNSGKCTSSRLKLFMMQSVVVKMSTPSFVLPLIVSSQHIMSGAYQVPSARWKQQIHFLLE